MKFRSDPVSSSDASWTDYAEHSLGEQRPHASVLGQVDAGRVGRRADVEQHERSLRGRHLDGQRGSIDARQAPQVEDGRGDAGARMARGHDGIGQPVANEAHADVDRGIALPANGGRGMLVHVDDLAGVDDPDVARRGALGGDRAPNELLVADEDDLLVRVLAGMEKGALDRLGGPVVAAHGIDRDPDGTLGRESPDGTQVHGRSGSDAEVTPATTMRARRSAA
jgi:hypothetical protein